MDTELALVKGCVLECRLESSGVTERVGAGPNAGHLQ